VYAAGAGTCASSIYRVAVDGRTASQLLVPGVSGPVLEAAIASAGDEIAYVQDNCDSTAAELVVRRLTSSAPAVVLYRANQGQGIHMVRWGANGWLSFLTAGPQPRLHTMAATPGGRVSTSPPAPTSCFWSGADWFVQRGQNLLLASQQCGTGSRWLILNQHLGTVRTLKRGRFLADSGRRVSAYPRKRGESAPRIRSDSASSFARGLSSAQVVVTTAVRPPSLAIRASRPPADSDSSSG
jgi:hypothetical protein